MLIKREKDFTLYIIIYADGENNTQN